MAVTEHRRRTAWAHVVRDLLEGRYQDADTRIDWQFTTEDARIKLRSLYPSIQP